MKPHGFIFDPGLNTITRKFNVFTNGTYDVETYRRTASGAIRSDIQTINAAITAAPSGAIIKYAARTYDVSGPTSQAETILIVDKSLRLELTPGTNIQQNGDVAFPAVSFIGVNAPIQYAEVVGGTFTNSFTGVPTIQGEANSALVFKNCKDAAGFDFNVIGVWDVNIGFEDCSNYSLESVQSLYAYNRGFYAHGESYNGAFNNLFADNSDPLTGVARAGTNYGVNTNPDLAIIAGRFTATNIFIRATNGHSISASGEFATVNMNNIFMWDLGSSCWGPIAQGRFDAGSVYHRGSKATISNIHQVGGFRGVVANGFDIVDIVAPHVYNTTDAAFAFIDSTNVRMLGGYGESTLGSGIYVKGTTAGATKNINIIGTQLQGFVNGFVAEADVATAVDAVNIIAPIFKGASGNAAKANANTSNIKISGGGELQSTGTAHALSGTSSFIDKKTKLSSGGAYEATFSFNGTTNTNGILTIPHGLAATPVISLVTLVSGTQSRALNVTGRDGTNVLVRCYNTTDNSNIASTSIFVDIHVSL